MRRIKKLEFIRLICLFSCYSFFIFTPAFAKNDGARLKVNGQIKVLKNFHLPFQFHNPGDESFNTQWQIVSHLDDHSLLTIVFGIHNYGYGDGHGMIAIRYLPSKGERIVHIIENIKPSVENDGSGIRFGNNQIVFDKNRYQISVKSEKLSLNAWIEALSKPVIIGNGRFFEVSKDQFISLEIPIPRGIISGTLQTENQTSLFTGFAYMDHSKATLNAAEISEIWRSFRIHSNEYTLNFLAIDGLKGSADSRYILAQYINSDGQMATSNDCELDGNWDKISYTSSDKKTDEKWSLSCRFKDGPMIVNIQEMQIVDEIQAFGHLSSISRMIGRLITNEPKGFVNLHHHIIDVRFSTQNITFQGTGYDELLDLKGITNDR